MDGYTLSVLRCSDISLNRDTQEVFRGDRLIQLTEKEFELLEYLMKYRFKVVTRSQILEAVWGYDSEEGSHIVEVYIRYLGRKLGATSTDNVIHTVCGIGYILRDPVCPG